MKYICVFIFSVTMACPTLFSQGVVKAVFVDEHGMKWFGTERGLIRFDGYNWIDYTSHTKIPDQISDIEYQSSDYGPEIWIGSDKGVSVAAFNIDGITSATLYTRENSGIISDTVHDVMVDENNIRYFATPEGLGIFNSSTWSSVVRGSDIPDATVLSLAYKNDTIYAGTDGRGVGRVIRDDLDGYTGASYYEIPWVGLPSNIINCVYIDSKGFQWYGTTEGASRHEVQEAQQGWEIYLTMEQGLKNSNVMAILEDDNGEIWLGTEGGVSRYNPADAQIINYTMEDGLPDSVIYDIAMDTDQTLWFATGKGVSHFDGAGFHNYLVSGIENISIPPESGIIYPNPASNEIHITHYSNQQGFVTIAAFDLSGKKIETIYNGYAPAGEVRVTWDLNDSEGKPVPAGIYIISKKSGSYNSTKKVVVIPPM